MDTIRKALAFAALTLAALIITACSDKPPQSVSSEPVRYAVPVDAGCVGTGGRPAQPKTLKERYPLPQWTAMPPGAKAQAAAAQGGERLNFEGEDGAATATCH